MGYLFYSGSHYAFISIYKCLNLQGIIFKTFLALNKLRAVVIKLHKTNLFKL